ncbi:MAG: TetR/AcrR family transcriptional regulator [Bacteroidota bacterium]
MPSTQAKPTKLSTEEKIHRAAIDVFTRKGYDGTKTRDIAEEAGINVATLHYYHRTKEQLFNLVARESLKEFASIQQEVFTLDTPLRDKVSLFVTKHLDLLREQPHLAMFCLVESERNPEAFHEIIDFRIPHRVVGQQLQELNEAGKIRPMSVYGFISALVGMTIYPFITKNGILHNSQMTGAEFNAFIEEQKVIIPAMINGYLFKE